MSISLWQHLEMVFVKVSLTCCIVNFEKQSAVAHVTVYNIPPCICPPSLMHYMGAAAIYSSPQQTLTNRTQLKLFCSNVRRLSVCM